MGALKTIKQLLILDKEGKVSHTVFFSSVAYAIASWIMVNLTINSKLTEDYLLWYLAIVAGHTSVSKFLSLRGQKKDE